MTKMTKPSEMTNKELVDYINDLIEEEFPIGTDRIKARGESLDKIEKICEELEIRKDRNDYKDIVKEQASCLEQVKELRKQHDVLVRERKLKIANEVLESKGEKDKYGIPVSVKMEWLEKRMSDNDSEKTIREMMQKFLDEHHDYNKEEEKIILDYIVDEVIPIGAQTIGEHLGEMFDEENRDMEKLYKKAIVRRPSARKDKVYKKHEDIIEDLKPFWEHKFNDVDMPRNADTYNNDYHNRESYFDLLAKKYKRHPRRIAQIEEANREKQRPFIERTLWK